MCVCVSEAPITVVRHTRMHARTHSLTQKELAGRAPSTPLAIIYASIYSMHAYIYIYMYIYDCQCTRSPRRSIVRPWRVSITLAAHRAPGRRCPRARAQQPLWMSCAPAQACCCFRICFFEEYRARENSHTLYTYTHHSNMVKRYRTQQRS